VIYLLYICQLASTLTNELVNFRLKVNIATEHDSYEAWRKAVHDYLLLAAWYGD
jgi:hypothetical protein